MSMMRCDHHGPWDSDNWETCPQCEYDLTHSEKRISELTAENKSLKAKLVEAEKKMLMEPWDLMEGLKKDRTAAVSQWKAANERAAAAEAENATLRENLQCFIKSAIPVSTEITPKGYTWSHVYLDGALAAAIDGAKG